MTGWLTENYERVEGVCLPRCVLYTHYLDFCKKNTFTPAGAATFGKIIRQKFPKLTTRRLGTRGQSRYHYYGIGIKQTSVYYQSVYSGRGLTRFSGVKIKTEGSNRKYSLSSKTGTLLPEFPEVDNLILPEDVCPEKMKTLLMMYRTHCQRILDTVISANFDEVQNLLLHFWQGMPGHLTQLLHSDILCAIVALCDSILYKVLADILVPPSIQDIPDSLSAEIKLFTRKLPCWISAALDSVPDSIRQRKIESAKGFIQSVRRQLSFVHLAQTARSVLANQEGVAQMLEDLGDVDFRQVLCQAVYTQPPSAHSYRHSIMEFFTEFQSLLKKQSPVEAYTEWIDNIVDTFVLQPCKEKDIGFLDRSADFLLQWAMFGSLLMKELTLHNAISFGAFHLLHVMLDEYVFLVLETQREQSRDHQLQTHVQRHMKNWETIKCMPRSEQEVQRQETLPPRPRNGNMRMYRAMLMKQRRGQKEVTCLRADRTLPQAVNVLEMDHHPSGTSLIPPRPSPAHHLLYPMKLPYPVRAPRE
ncbi:DNA-binding protein RFX6-like [Pomacea canaliculata]|uniref:DNA-binding protein RFX6-like n=1 Tax=Pomacea canaliculata TaxID=400727 RepID=UPI000D72D55C|nr:DNA-binding protein RFX6-like [Pomacea canaliculata]